MALKNPLIAGSAEHLIDPDGALRAGVGAVVVKSANESEAARHQIQCAKYMILDDRWQPLPWNTSAPLSAFVAARELIGGTADRRKAFAAMPLRQDNWRRYVPS